MTLVGNTFFWTFFFMIGFVASIELVEDLGPEMAQRWFGRKVPAAVLIAVYVVLILLFVRMLRVFGTTYSWTANALRNGTLIYISKRLNNRTVFRWMLVGVFISFYPFWDWNPVAIAGFAVTLLLLIPLNNHQEWIKANHMRHGAVLIAISLIYWGFDMYAYQYQWQQTLMVAVTFMVVIALAHGYDHLLVYRKRETQALQYDNQHDALTGAQSLSKFATDFSRFRRLSASGSMVPVHLVMIDIDHFKRINDTYGHLAGDTVLKTFAHDLDDYLATVLFPATLYRTGGEEFSILVAGDATLENTRAIVDAYMQHLQRLTVPVANTQIQLTISVGITPVRDEDADNSAVIARADRHLYEAKSAGRNTVVAKA